MLKPATNKHAYAKVGIYGTAGSGKTYTAAKIAVGLHKFAKCHKPIGMFDTEPAASYIIPLFKEAGIPFLVYDESRALKDLMAFMDEAEKECSIVIVDSITHVWRDIQESYINKINEDRASKRKPKLFALEFHHWRPIKARWAEFTDRFLSSKLHVIVCGRAGSIYEYQENQETGKKELITTGTRMATEKELGYEPSLLIEMIAAREGGKIVNRALIQKDRADKMNGDEIDSPDFEKLKAHFLALNIGGEHFDSMDAKDSKDLFDADGQDEWTREVRQREIQCEELKEKLQQYYPGTTQNEKLFKSQWLERIFGTRAWSAVEGMNSDRVKSGRERLIDELQQELTKAAVEKEALSKAKAKEAANG